MAEALTSMQAQILDKTKEDVQALLGEPMTKRYWKNMEPPPGADAAAVASHAASLLDEIWIYPNGRVHFSLSGLAKKVDDKTHLDIPPPDMLV